MLGQQRGAVNMGLLDMIEHLVQLRWSVMVQNFWRYERCQGVDLMLPILLSVFELMPDSARPLRLCSRRLSFSYDSHSWGFTLIEVMTAVMILGVLTAIAAPIILFGTNSLKDTTARLASNIKLLRAKAVSQTSAYRLRAAASATGPALSIEHATLCSDTAWTADPSFAVEDTQLDRQVQITQVFVNGVAQPVDNWSVCYTSRGLATRNVTLTLTDAQRGGTTTITVFPGGEVDVQGTP